jgi:hypothetical protein
MAVNVDSTIWPVHGDHRQSPAFGYSKVLGYHPVVGSRAETSEVLHARFHKGSTGEERWS